MLGNLAAFLFAGANITSLLIGELDPQFHPGSWSGTYQDLLPYLQNAFTKVIETVAQEVHEDPRDFVMEAVRELCTPDLTLRGCRKMLGHHDTTHY
jgi:hypothetical protein